MLGTIYLFGSSVHLAMGTSLVAMIPLATIGGLINSVVDLHAAVLLGIGTTIGAQMGARLIKRFKQHVLKLIFGLYFLYVSLKYILISFGICI